MATIKSYTDIEQCKKLAEILPLESADMHWYNGLIGLNYFQTDKDFYDTTINSYLPCWSLAALLGVLPEIQGGNPIIDLDDNYITYPHISDLYTKANNLIDACVAMIEKLHKSNLL